MSATLLLVHIIGTIALMLWGMRMVRTGVERAAGDSLGRRLESWTRNRVVACLSGIVATLALQSSTATAILINGFVVRNAVSTSAALAVILGADIGTTLVAAILSFDLSMVAPFLIAAGFIGHSS
ncbi:MAG: phosphate:Na+ symporter, partial [Gammaproteobacteria bacterium]